MQAGSLLSCRAPALPSPPLTGLRTLRTLGCIQPWEPGSLRQRVGPVQSHASSQWPLTQGHLTPGTTGQADALRISVLTCPLVLERLAPPTSCAGARAPATQGSRRPKRRPQHPQEPAAPHPPSPLTGQNGARMIRGETFAAGCGPAAGTPGARGCSGRAEVFPCR